MTAMATSYNGWPASPDPDRIGINRGWEPIAGHDFPGGIKSGDVEVVMTYLVRQLNARVEVIDHYPAGDEWGYHYKQSANSPDLLSCHSSGTAIDYNATRHPNGQRGTWTSAQVAEIREILAELDGVVRWLGDATRVPDEMHFEIHGTPTQVAAVAARLRADSEQEDPMRFRIVWYKGEPTAAGDQPDATAAYVSQEAKDALTGRWFQVKAVHIESPKDLELLRSFGMHEVKTGPGSQGQPLAQDTWDAGGDWVNGPFRN